MEDSRREENASSKGRVLRLKYSTACATLTVLLMLCGRVPGFANTFYFILLVLSGLFANFGACTVGVLSSKGNLLQSEVLAWRDLTRSNIRFGLCVLFHFVCFAIFVFFSFYLMLFLSCFMAPATAYSIESVSAFLVRRHSECSSRSVDLEVFRPSRSQRVGSVLRLIFTVGGTSILSTIAMIFLFMLIIEWPFGPISEKDKLLLTVSCWVFLTTYLTAWAAANYSSFRVRNIQETR